MTRSDEMPIAVLAFNCEMDQQVKHSCATCARLLVKCFSPPFQSSGIKSLNRTTTRKSFCNNVPHPRQLIQLCLRATTRVVKSKSFNVSLMESGLCDFRALGCRQQRVSCAASLISTVPPKLHGTPCALTQHCNASSRPHCNPQVAFPKLATQRLCQSIHQA